MLQQARKAAISWHLFTYIYKQAIARVDQLFLPQDFRISAHSLDT